MANLSILSDEESWNKAMSRLLEPSVLCSYSMVNAGTLLFPGDKAVAEAVVYEENGEILFYPYIKRPCPYLSDWFDICSAYEFGGFWFSTEDAAVCNQLMRRFETEFREYALKAHIVSEFIRIDPFCKLGSIEWQEYELSQSGQHIVIPTQSGEKSIWHELFGTRRTDIRWAQKNKLRMEFSDDVKTFTEIYYKRLDALNSYQFYYFPEAYLERIPFKQIVFVYDNHNEICGAYVWIQDHKNLFYFLSADVAEKRPLRPSSFAIYEMCKWACANGVEYIHLGGGAETLYHFKSLFSPHRVNYYLAKRIINQAAYEEMVVQHKSFKGELTNKGYFPLYRLDTAISHSLTNMRRYTATQSEM